MASWTKAYLEVRVDQWPEHASSFQAGVHKEFIEISAIILFGQEAGRNRSGEIIANVSFIAFLIDIQDHGNEPLPLINGGIRRFVSRSGEDRDGGEVFHLVSFHEIDAIVIFRIDREKVMSKMDLVLALVC